MPKNNEIEQLVNGQVADANPLNQIILNAGNESGMIPYSEDDHQRDTLGQESVGQQAYPWGSFYVNESASLNEVATAGASISATVLFSNLRKWIYQKDTPASYTGNAHKLVSVNSGESALEFFPTSFSGLANKVLSVNEAETAFEIITSPEKSNTIFSFALGTGTANTNGVILNDSITAAETEITNLYWATNQSNSNTAQVITSQWIKLAGVNTVTIYCRIWTQGGGAVAICEVDIGTASNSVNGTASQTTPEWKTFDIDVSGLTDGDPYVVSIKLGNTSIIAVESYMDSIIAFGIK